MIENQRASVENIIEVLADRPQYLFCHFVAVTTIDSSNTYQIFL